MAMPSSGSIAIISAPQTCGSICAAVGCASGSLTTLSVAAGKSAPHAMSEFYGYMPPAPIAINFHTIACSVSQYNSYWNACTTPIHIAQVNDCYCACIGYSLSVGAASNIQASASFICNGSTLFTCTIAFGIPQSGSFSYTRCYGDIVCACVRACHTLGTVTACATISINSITDIVGDYCLGTTLTSITAIAGLS